MTTTMAKPKRGRPPRTAPLPCVRCGTTAGRIHSKGATPERLNGAVFGCPGKLCRKCYEHLRNIYLKASGKGHRKTDAPPKAKPAAPTAPQAAPCADCGTTAGRIPAGCKTPARHPGETVGRRGLLCTRCYNRAYERKRVAEARALAEEVGDSMDLYRRVRLEKFTAFGFMLPVLTPPFFRDDLTPRAESRLLIREAHRKTRRARRKTRKEVAA